MTTIGKILYTGKSSVTAGGRNGRVRSADGGLDFKLSAPGSSGGGTNPEQLFAACWSACFIDAIGLAAEDRNVVLPADLMVAGEVDLGQTGAGYQLQVRLNVSMPGIPRGLAQMLIDAAHQICPYSRATHGNVIVTIQLVKQIGEPVHAMADAGHANDLPAWHA